MDAFPSILLPKPAFTHLVRKTIQGMPTLTFSSVSANIFKLHTMDTFVPQNWHEMWKADIEIPIFIPRLNLVGENAYTSLNVDDKKGNYVSDTTNKIVWGQLTIS